MHFDYEIPIEEFAAAQVLYCKANAKAQFVKWPLGWGLLGLFFVLTAILRWETDWGPILLLLTGAWFVYGAIAMLFPMRHYCRYNADSGLAGKKYRAELDERGFSVNGDGCSWRVSWSEARLRGEDQRVFMFSGKGTIFIFGKKYLTDEQKREVRQFATMS